MSDSADPDMPFNALGLDEPPQPAATTGAAYRVLARKYRPQTFAELIGQDAMVQTLGNAIARGRLAHAFLMTGVRGVGKTSTARLIAKALNCIGADGQGGPTIDPCGVCEPCHAIAEGRHIDVIEMDAASHTGVDDVREIIEAVRYAAVSARYKIYIIDEVHMLSKNAFNALLKTLEEPPPHVKFLFATTEVNKVPVTVLSRCQRFDLRRITPEMLFGHFNHILALEGVEAEAPAVWMIANAAEGSVRDGLSILDQAIAHSDLDGHAAISAAHVRAMLGLSDRSRILRLLNDILNGDAKGAIEGARAQYALGAEPIAMVRGLMDVVHAISVAKISQHDDPALNDADRAQIGEWAQKMGHGTLGRLWQLLVKGHEEVLRATSDMDSLDMVLLRVIHAASMPDPAELVRLIREGGVAMPPASAPTPQEHGADAPPTANDNGGRVADFGIDDIFALFDAAGRHGLAVRLNDDVAPVRVAANVLHFEATAAADAALARDLADALLAVTGARWDVRAVAESGAPTRRARHDAAADADVAALMDNPLVQAGLAAFPGAKLVGE
ncbi:MAG: hypothetical protein RLZZ58_176 [Pseudomonadota bacterium]